MEESHIKLRRCFCGITAHLRKEVRDSFERLKKVSLLLFLAWNLGIMGAEMGIGVLALEMSSQPLQKQIRKMIVFPLSLPHSIAFSVSAKEGAYVVFGNFAAFVGLGYYYLDHGIGNLNFVKAIVVLLVAALQTLEILLCGVLLRKSLCSRFKKVPTIDSLRDAMHYFVIVFLVSVFSEAVITLFHCLAKMVTWHHYVLHWATWSLGTIAAMVTVSPFIIHAFAWRPQKRFFTVGKVLEAIVIGVIMVTLLVLVYTFAVHTYFKPLPYLLFPVIVHTAFRFNRIGWALVLLVISLFCTWATAERKGALYSISGDDHVEPRLVVQIQLFVSVTAAVAISLAAAVREKKQLAKKLERLNEKLESLVHQKTHQLMKANEELKASQLAAEQASKSKSDFLANMSHEIRTPIHGILGMSSLILGSNLTDEQQESMATLRECAELLLHIINSILDLAKIEAGRFEVETIDFNIRRVLKNTMLVLEPRTRQRSLQLKLEIDDEVPENIAGDSGKLQQCLLNLVGNALKFTHRGSVTLDVKLHGPSTENDPVLSKIDLSWPEDSEGITEITETLNLYVPRHRTDISTPGASKAVILFRVRDTGIGISKEKLRDIFKPFNQADASISRLYGGTGLGLSIVQRFVELMGGHIMADSEPGNGSTFYVFLPFYVKDSKGNTVPFRREIFSCNEEEEKVKPTAAHSKMLELEMEKDEAFNALAPEQTEIEEIVPDELVFLEVGWDNWHDECTGTTSNEAVRSANIPSESNVGQLSTTTTLERQDQQCETLLAETLTQKASEPETDSFGEINIAKPQDAEHDEPEDRSTNEPEQGTVEPQKGSVGLTTEPQQAIADPSLADGKAKPGCRAELVIDIDSIQATTKKPEFSPPAPPSSGVFRILLVEDNIVNQKVACKLLQKFGHVVSIVADGVQAVDAVHTHRDAYDLVLMDIQMPNMDGLEATRCIRIEEEKLKCKKLPIIGLTAHAMQGYQETCFSAGMNGYMPKPFQITQVLALIQKVLNSPREVHITIKDLG